MKKVIRIVLVFACFLPTLVQAQVFGGPRTYVNVVNNTDRPVHLEIGRATAVVGPYGSMSNFKTGWFPNQGDIGVYATVCKATSTSHGINSAPTDENFPLDDLAITDEFLQTRPDMDALKHKVDAIKASIKKQPGADAFKKRLDAWLKEVKTEGLMAYHVNCNPEFTIAAKIPFQGIYYNGGNQIINIVLENDGRGKCQLRSGQYVYSY